MKAERAISIIWASGIYDGVLGLIFLFTPAAMFARFGVTPPNHWGYVQFGAALLLIFGIGIASTCVTGRKAAACGTT